MEDVSPRGKVKEGRGKRRRLEAEGYGEISVFAATMKESDVKRLEFQTERLALDRELMAMDACDREKERDLHREEGEGRDRLEVPKFKLMIGTFSAHK